MSGVGITGIEVRQKLLEDALGSNFKNQMGTPTSETQQGDKSKATFMDYLKNGISEINESQKTADKMAVDLATGKEQNVHETMLAATQAELSFNLMVQIRNKALDAYQEIMRMPV